MTHVTSRSESLFRRAVEAMPGGVSSPVRAWKSVGGTPLHLARGQGALVWDVDGNEYVDLVCSYGPLLLGHASESVTRALQAAAERGTTFGTPTEGEVNLADVVTERVPGLEMVRFVNSGTEATMSALRLARAATGRDLMIKFDGCYHGHGDSFLVKAGSGALTLGAPDSPGVPAALAAMTLVADYNDVNSVRRLFEEHPGEVACVFVEPVAGNMGCVPPEPGFLEGLRELCDEHGALLVYDEVMTGFRVARGGFLDRHVTRADLVTLGKVIGGGLPIAAYGGRRDLMQRIAPAGDVYQAGTLSGNPLAVAAGLATLAATDEPGFYERLDRASSKLATGLEAAARAAGVAIQVPRVGAMLCVYFADAPVRRFPDVMASRRELFTPFFHAMVAEGVLLPPSPFEAWFLSSAHDDEIVERVTRAAEKAFRALGA
ncbi:MAG: glutamate-1-semialdehyde 2,1-aminomutase [Planctomycetota bacterium]